MTNNKEALLEVKGLKKYFPQRHGFLGRDTRYVKAVDGLDFKIYRGETFGLVGESGCGKSTTGRTIIRLYDITEGQVILVGVDISELSQKELIPYRKKMQMIFQDPYASLNSRMTVSDIIGEALDIHGLATGDARRDRINYLLNRVGLTTEHASRYPHEFSGGQRQRIGIARALAVDPEFIICDEPISALDVSIQAQVVNMLDDLQSELGLTYMFIAHDLSMVKHISDRIAVMYLGRIVEIGEADRLYDKPEHPYTQALLSAVPIPDPDVTRALAKNRVILEGDVPSPLNPPSGCRFRTRCLYSKPVCSTQIPELEDLGDGHQVACHFTGKLVRNDR